MPKLATAPQRWEQARHRIPVERILKLLEDYVLTGEGAKGMTSTKMRAIELLLRKTLGDLSLIDGVIQHNHAHVVRHISITPVQPTQNQAPALIESRPEAVSYDAMPTLIEDIER